MSNGERAGIRRAVSF